MADFAITIGAVVPIVADVVSKAAGLRLLVLHGSRARATHRPDSDWDFAYLADASFDADALLAGLSEALGSNDIDLADLSRASGLLRFKAASEGHAVHEAQPGQFDTFRLAAAAAWCDMEPVLRRAFDARLESTTP